MTDPTTPIELPGSVRSSAAEPDDFDGHTIEELSDYLDRNQTPPDESIDTSARCQMMLASLQRLHDLSATWLDAAAAVEPERDDSWVAGILQHISLEARAGRDIPLTHESDTAELFITEGAVRGMIRAVGDQHGSIIIGRCRIQGDVTLPETPITIAVDASVFWGRPIPDTVASLRAAIAKELNKHTSLVIAGIDITVHDIQLLPTELDETH